MLIAMILLCGVQCPAQKFFQVDSSPMNVDRKLVIVKDTCGDCEEIEKAIQRMNKEEKYTKGKVETASPEGKKEKFNLGFRTKSITLKIKKFFQRNFSSTWKQRKYLKVTCYKW
jgi:hypothetical protein